MGFCLFYGKWWRSSDETAGPMDTTVVNCVWEKTKKRAWHSRHALLYVFDFFLPIFNLSV